MAASNVNVLCPNGRRQTVKVSPNTRLLEIIETVCQKQKFNADEYNLKHQRTILDVQVPFRYANLPNNAKLDLVKADRPRSQTGPTLVALQLPTGERVQHSFESSTSLWQLLRHWEEQGDWPSSLTTPPSSSDATLHPVCIYMREEIIGEAWLKATTLKGLGLTGGKAIIRLLHRNVELPPPPKPEQSKRSKTDTNISSTIPAATLQGQVVRPNTSSNTEALGQSINADRNVTLDKNNTVSSQGVPPVTASGNTPAGIKLIPAASLSDTAMDCAISDVRDGDESPMDVDSAGENLEKGKSDSQKCESTEKVSIEMTVSKTEQRVVRPKEGPQVSEPSTSQAEGGRSEEEKAQDTMKAIGDSAGLSLDEYAKKRIQSLLEKEEEMVDSMQQALMESLAEQTAGFRKQPQRAETRPSQKPFADFKFPETSASHSGKGKELSKQDTQVKPCDRSQLVFSTGQEVGMKPVEVPDQFFDVTVDDVRRMLSNLRHQSGESDKDLETRAMREAREQLKMRKYEKVVVRVHFPDRVILQGFFRPQETVGAVKEFVKWNLADGDQQFYLYTTPPKMELKDMKQTLFKAKLFPAAVIYFGTSKQQDHYLHEDILGDLATLLQAESVVAQNMKTGGLRESSTKSSEATTSGSSSSAPSSSSAALTSATSADPSEGQGSTSNGQKRQAASPSGSALGSTKVPKWFKVGKK